MTRILALDTSSEACSVALLNEGVIVENYVVEPRKHSSLILPMVDELLNKHQYELSQLDALAYGAGPGSFTGLRIACGVIQGLAYGAGLPVIPVSTLAALALQVRETVPAYSGYIFSALDARMDEIYWGCYQLDGELVKPVQNDVVCRIADIQLSPGVRGIGIGSAYKNLGQAMAEQLGEQLLGVCPSIYPRASAIASLAATKWQQGEAVSAEAAQPFYLRNKVAKKAGEK